MNKKSNERVFVFFLQERIAALEIEEREVKKVEEFNKLSAQLCAYNECLEIFSSLFNVSKKIKVK